MKKIVTLLLSLTMVLNLFTVVTWAQTTTDSDSIDFTSYEVGEVPAELGLSIRNHRDSKYYTTEFGIVEDGDANVLKWSNVDKNEALAADLESGVINNNNIPEQDLFIPADKAYNLAEGPVTIDMTAKVPYATSFRLIPTGTKTSDGTENYVFYASGMTAQIKDASTEKLSLVSSINWTQLNPVIYLDEASYEYYDYRIVLNMDTTNTNQRSIHLYAKKSGTETWSSCENMWINPDHAISDVTGLSLKAILTNSKAENGLQEFYVKNVSFSQDKVFNVESHSAEIDFTNLSSKPSASDFGVKFTNADFGAITGWDFEVATVKEGDDDVQVLKTTLDSADAAGWHFVSFPLPKSFDLSDGPVTIETTAKIANADGSRIVPLGTFMSGAESRFHYGAGFNVASGNVVNGVDNGWRGTGTVSISDASTKYYTYKIVVQNETECSDTSGVDWNHKVRQYDLYVKPEGGTEWYHDGNGKIVCARNLKSINGLAFNTQTAAQLAAGETLEYHIKNIKISQIPYDITDNSASIDYTQFAPDASATELEVGFNDSSYSTVAIATDAGKSVFKWSFTNPATGNQRERKLYIPLSKTFDFANGPITIETTAKISETGAVRVMPLGTNMKSNAASFTSYATGILSSPTEWRESSSVNPFNPSLTMAELSAGYYIYKIVLYPETTGTTTDGQISRYYDVYVKKADDENAQWCTTASKGIIKYENDLKDINGVSFMLTIPASTEEAQTRDVYVRDVKVSQGYKTLTPTAVAVGNQTVTNVGENVTDYVKLVFADADAGYFAQMPATVNVEVTAANGVVSTKTATKLAGENAYRIETMDLSGMSTTAGSSNIYVKEGTASIKLSAVGLPDAVVNFASASITVGDILPLAYKEGKIIKNVALNRVGTNAENLIRKNGARVDGDEGYSVGRANVSTLTDGILYPESTAREAVAAIDAALTTRWAGMVLYTLDLGATFDIAGLAISGTNSYPMVNQGYWIEVNGNESNPATDTIAADTIINADLRYDKRLGHQHDEANTVIDNQIASNFSMSESSRYVHVGTVYKDYRVDISEIMVFAYVGTEPEVVEPEISIALKSLDETGNENEYKVEVAVNSNVDIADAKCIIAIKTTDGKLLSADIVPVTDAVAGILTGYVTITESEIEEGVVTEGYLWKPDQSPYINKTPLEME